MDVGEKKTQEIEKREKKKPVSFRWKRKIKTGRYSG